MARISMGADAGAADRPPNTPDGVRGAKEPDVARPPNAPDGARNVVDGVRVPKDPDGVTAVVACSGGLIGQGDEVSDFAVTGGFVVMGSDDGAAPKHSLLVDGEQIVMEIIQDVTEMQILISLFQTD